MDVGVEEIIQYEIGCGIIVNWNDLVMVKSTLKFVYGHTNQNNDDFSFLNESKYRDVSINLMDASIKWMMSEWTKT